MKDRMKFTFILIGLIILTVPIIFAENDVIPGDLMHNLPFVGNQTGGFFNSLAPGAGVFIIILGIFGGTVAIIMAVVSLIKRKISI